MSVVSYAAVPYVGFRRGKIITSLGLRPAIAEAISQAEEIAGKRADSVVVGVPTLYTNTVPMLSADGGDDWLAPEDPENKSYQPIHYLKYSVEGEDGPVPMMAAIMMEHAFEAEVETALRNIKLRSREFIAQSYATGMHYIPRLERQHVAILFNIGYYISDIAVFMGDAQVFSATMYVGGGHVISDLSKVLNIGTAQAEQLARQFGFGMNMREDAMDYARAEDGRLESFSHRWVDQIISARLEEICSLAKDALEVSDAPFSEENRLYLLGEGLKNIPGGKEFIASCMEIKSEGLPIAVRDGTTQYDPVSMAIFEILDRRTENKKQKKSLLGHFGRK
ncbi:MAG: hypothetical protein IJP30_05115 [Clostridia bacterium]|nr:hypothetical protein [Clostridia bacterium]